MKFYSYQFILTAAVLSLSQGLSAQSMQKKPNIVFFLVDDLGWTDIESFGTTFYESPNIKQLANESMRFTEAYAACPVCSPSRVSILTGKYPFRLQTTDFFGARQPDEIIKTGGKGSQNKLLPAQYRDYLPLEETTIAEALKEGGYKTFFAGKWHLGSEEKYWPEAQGFDINIGGNRSGHPKSYFSPYSNPRLTDGPEGEHLTDRLANETTRFIENNREKPFFAYVSFYAVHTPLVARKDLEEKYISKKARLGLEDQFSKEGNNKVRMVQSHPTYAAMVQSMDEAVGKVVKKLKDEGLYDNTIIVFFSDNGGLSTSEGHPTSNLPLRAGKGWMYEGGIRVPLIIRWPGHTKDGSTCAQPVIGTDLYPSLLSMAGLTARPQQHKDGKSIVPFLEEKSNSSRPLVWHYPHYGNQGGSPGSAIRKGDWKLIRWYESGKEELYNLKEDVSETKNLIDKRRDIASDLRQDLDNILKESGAKMPAANPNYKPAK